MSEVITSAGNPTVKLLRRLSRSGKERREANLYIAEGIHLVRSLLTTGQSPVMYVCAESALNNHEVTELNEKLASTGAQQVIVADTIFDSIFTIHAKTGICIIFTPPAYKQASTITGNAVLLEDIQDPGNLGTILRTAAAAGVQNIALTQGCSSPWSPKALRAGMGAQFGLTIYEDTDLAKLIKNTNATTIATTLSSDSQSLYSLDVKKPILWLFGNEGQGVSGRLAKLADIRATIPQAPSSVESLNVASSVAVCLYEQYRQEHSASSAV